MFVSRRTPRNHENTLVGGRLAVPWFHIAPTGVGQALTPTHFQSSRSCPPADGHPETMKIARRRTDVARASRPHHDFQSSEGLTFKSIASTGGIGSNHNTYSSLVTVHRSPVLAAVVGCPLRPGVGFDVDLLKVG